MKKRLHWITDHIQMLHEVIAMSSEDSDPTPQVRLVQEFQLDQKRVKKKMVVYIERLEKLIDWMHRPWPISERLRRKILLQMPLRG